MSQTENLAAPKASFDRRSVVKTAAWSVPVIAAAIAAPAAAASAGNATVTLAPVPAAGTTSFVRVGQEGSPGQTRYGAASPKLTIQNGQGAIAGDITGIITITPNAPVAEKAPGVGFTSLTATSTTSYSGTFSGTAGRTYSGSFTRSGGLPTNGSLVLTFNTFRYNFTGNGTAVGGKYTLAVAVTFPGGRTVTETSTITLG
ncbi:hypothetical protein [Pseudarthrobacter sp. 1C304]|uniref:hypothetical protein n=1 Tax=Pseudarthrobacter sp. 1C304 TaxID=3457438 RepID=UPI003FD5BC99